MMKANSKFQIPDSRPESEEGKETKIWNLEFGIWNLEFYFFSSNSLNTSFATREAPAAIGQPP
jgi:hypothetical protein